MRLERRGRRVVALSVLFALAAIALAIPVAVSAADGKSGHKSGDGASAKRDKLAFFDSRQTPAAEAKLRNRDAKNAASPNPATDVLKDALGSEAVVAIDPLTSTPRMVGLLDGFLTGPSSASPESVALDYVNKNASAFGLDSNT